MTHVTPLGTSLHCKQVCLRALTSKSTLYQSLMFKGVGVPIYPKIMSSLFQDANHQVLSKDRAFSCGHLMQINAVAKEKKKAS